LLRDIDVMHPIFPDLAKLEEDRNFVNPRPGVVRLPVYISGAEVTANRIYVLLSLPQPEIIEFSITGEELTRYRAKSSVSGLSYFGFIARSEGSQRQFTLGIINSHRLPVLITLRASAGD
jgi:hypothetical protein